MTDERVRSANGTPGSGGGETADRDAAAPPRTGEPRPEIVRAEGAVAGYDSFPRDQRGWVFGDSPPEAALPSGMATNEQIDSFRELRTRLLLMATGSGLAHFTTIVVPVTEDAGGSFVARNLAATFTLQNRHALLVDCNFRNAAQQAALRADAEIEGLFEFLGRAGREPVGLPVWPTVIPGLHLIPAGRCETTLAAQVEYLSSSSMKALMTKLRDWPCYVVLDAPPVKGSPDARILSDLADFVVLVVGSGRSTTQDIAKAAAVFDRKKLAGVAFNEYAGSGAARRSR